MGYVFCNSVERTALCVGCKDPWKCNGFFSRYKLMKLVVNCITIFVAWADNKITLHVDGIFNDIHLLFMILSSEKHCGKIDSIIAAHVCNGVYPCEFVFQWNQTPSLTISGIQTHSGKRSARPWWNEYAMHMIYVFVVVNVISRCVRFRRRNAIFNCVATSFRVWWYFDIDKYPVHIGIWNRYTSHSVCEFNLISLIRLYNNSDSE